MKGRCHAGFTLLELLAVIAVIGILAGLLFPGIGAARRAAGKAKTRVQFNQWAAAIESFRGEYGYYPVFDQTNLVNGGVTAIDHPFHDVLAARRRDGSALVLNGSAAAQNRKLISLFAFSDSDFTPSGLIRDAFDNTEIAVLVDRNLDGMVNATDYPAGFPQVAGQRPDALDLPATGVRAGVIFYAPAPGTSADNPGFIFSWK